MNTDQQNRLEIMKALEKGFPDRLLEDLIDVARYVEGNGTPAITLQTPEVGIWHSKDNGNDYFTDTKPSDRSAVRIDTIANPDVDKINDLVARESRKPGASSPRTWTNLDVIPSTVKTITDRDGDRAEPEVVLGKRKWFFTDEPLDGVDVSPDVGPFTEVLENE